jgi:hypothetical protein
MPMRTKRIYEIHGTNFAWEKGFPKGYGHTSIAYLKRCPGFECAKNGDINAARRIVQTCVKPNRINIMLGNHPKSTLLPVLGKNVIPLALAQEIGLPTWNNVLRIDTKPRKSLPAIQRLLHKPVFVGHIQEGINYIIVDDIITQGGTIAALREYVLARGGKIVAVVALAYAIGSHNIAPTNEILFRLHFKFGYSIYVLQIIGLVDAFEELTYSQIRYLLMFSSIQNVCYKLEQTTPSIVINAKEKTCDTRKLRLAEYDKNNVAFAEELAYFPMLEKSQSQFPKSPIHNELTVEQKELFTKWASLAKEQQKQLLFELIQILK